MGKNGNGRVIACENSKNRARQLLATLRRFKCLGDDDDDNHVRASVLRTDSRRLLFRETGAIAVFDDVKGGGGVRGGGKKAAKVRDVVDGDEKKQEKTKEKASFTPCAEQFDRVLLDPPCSGLGQR
jgi:16S rRNA C967 or C1407 C5-methylase (RsmB/RsmF family)